MIVKAFQVGYFGTNCYCILSEDKKAVIIDPGGGYSQIKSYLEKEGKTAGAVLLTHGHFDHILDAKKFQAEGAKVYVGKEDADKLYTANNLAADVGFTDKSFFLTADKLLEGGETLNLFGLSIEVIYTPGHSKGSLCYLIGDSLFSGDTLFCESYGRTDFYDGSTPELIGSIKKLFALPMQDCTVYPGHDEPSTLAHERKNNPICAYIKPAVFRFIIERQDYLNDVDEIVRAFYPLAEVSDTAKSYLKADYKYENGVFSVAVTTDLTDKTESEAEAPASDELLFKKITKRLIKNTIYRALVKITGTVLPYGSLTGVRPTKLFYELKESGENPKDTLKTQFFVTDKKLELIERTVESQKDYINCGEKEIDIFVNIPFCPSRCVYCSFISSEIDKVKKQIPDYLDTLATEIDLISEIIVKNGLTPRAVYVGGGTPTALDASELERVTKMLSLFKVKEFTVEAGRPDSIDSDKLEILSKGGVTRISINPQTFNAKTLELIGRKHTVDDIFKAYESARKFNFDINMDLIAALPEEGVVDFKNSLISAIKLAPENITVHTLSIKRGSKLAELNEKKAFSGLGNSMVEYSVTKLISAGYAPYYMYRQKAMCDNLENTGYAKPNKQCVYNIDIMEETCSVLGAGAGAISKRVDRASNKIEREGNPKFLKEYIERKTEILIKKSNLFLRNN